MERLESRVRWVWIATAIFRTLFLGLVLFTALAALQWGELWEGSLSRLGWGVTGFLVVLLTIRVAVAWRRYSVFRFDLREESLYIERGVFTRIKTVVPYVRIQHVDSRRSPLERVVGLGTLVVYTAGSRSADVAVPGLDPERAEDLQNTLRERTIETVGEDAV
ncbi:PH domain-containing protein [Natronosalvus vescus]|uniref:PH domain-containing protein n=1 Tax=Natronosalvus vescus TaxID=2953881 RepID=UPI002090E27C|nr:PH domain-containing protein [Natronosalvus vescus]